MAIDFEDELVGSLRSKLNELGGSDLFNSWTVVAAIFAFDSKTKLLELISIGTGVKCISDKMIRAKSMELVHDMQAETICRRSFIIFLYKNIIKVFSNHNQKNNYISFDPSSQKY